MDTAPDTNFIQWLINAIVGLGIIAFGWINVRMNRMEDENSDDHKGIVAETRENAQVMWDQIERNLGSFNDFKQHVYTHMVTKEDLRDVKRELIEVIRGKV